ncbi:MAG: hypothetical protein IT514_10580 [Burkholderiales bacterium]|nr:hypothetical protein [Burkholderiales bacterium]
MKLESRCVVFVKRVAALALACLAATALAQPPHPEPRRFPPPRPAEARPPAKQVDHRMGGGERPHFQRLSPEERRQLRRDIDEHGREIYREPGRGRR